MSSSVVVYVGMGGNLGDPFATLRWAARRLSGVDQTRVETFSPLYRSEPMGMIEQPEFANAVAKVTTSLSPRALLNALHQIENECGRDRGGPRWGPRSLDLDILLYDDILVAENGLVIPHPHMTQRNFVLVPLYDVAGGDLTITGKGVLRNLIVACPSGGLERVGEF